MFCNKGTALAGPYETKFSGASAPAALALLHSLAVEVWVLLWCVCPEAQRQVERAWLKYRDAWLEFAQLRYPSFDRFAWLTFLTVNKTKNLREIQTSGY